MTSKAEIETLITKKPVLISKTGLRLSDQNAACMLEFKSPATSVSSAGARSLRCLPRSIQEHRLAEEMSDLGTVFFDVVEFVHVDPLFSLGDDIG